MSSPPEPTSTPSSSRPRAQRTAHAHNTRQHTLHAHIAVWTEIRLQLDRVEASQFKKNTSFYTFKGVILKSAARRALFSSSLVYCDSVVASGRGPVPFSGRAHQVHPSPHPTPAVLRAPLRHSPAAASRPQRRWRAPLAITIKAYRRGRAGWSRPDSQVSIPL